MAPFANTFLSDQAAGRTVAVFGQFNFAGPTIVNTNDTTLVPTAPGASSFVITFGAAGVNPFVGRQPTVMLTPIGTEDTVMNITSFTTATDVSTGETLWTAVTVQARNGPVAGDQDSNFQFIIWGERKR